MVYGIMNIKPAHNKGLEVGQKTPFTREQIELIRATLIADRNLRDLAMLQLGLDTMLRGSDLVRLRTDTIIDWQGQVVDEFVISQKKTRRKVTMALTDMTKKHVEVWLTHIGKTRTYVFPGRYHGEHLSIDRYRAAVKQWARIARVDPRKYSTHSIRRTKASIVYKETGSIEVVRQLLGHRDTSATSAYLDVGTAEVMEIARKIEV